MAFHTYLGVLCSAYLCVGLLNCLQVLILTDAMRRGLERNPESFRKFIPEILMMETLVERVGWPLLLAQFTILWPLFLKQLLVGSLYLASCVLVGIKRVLRFILLMGVDLK